MQPPSIFQRRNGTLSPIRYGGRLDRYGLSFRSLGQGGLPSPFRQETYRCRRRMRERWVIVDDGSTDRTVGNCAGLCETLSLDRKRFSFEGPALLFGYCWGALRRINRPVSSQLMQFYRHEQMEKLKAIILSWCKLKRVDNFHLAPERK